MKKLKKIALVLLAVAMVFCLCGCDALDQMRQRQAFYDDSGNILCNGVTYRKLPYCELLSPQTDYATTLYVTEPDVPVLLSQVYCKEYLEVSTDGNFLYDYVSFYCRADVYEDICKRIAEPFEPEVMCYGYDAYDEQTGEFLWKTYTLTQEQAELVVQIIKTEEPVIDAEAEDQWVLQYDWAICLEECSSDLLFRRGGLEIAYSNGNYYVIQKSVAATLVYPVPEGCEAAFGQITDAYVHAYDIPVWDETSI